MFLLCQRILGCCSSRLMAHSVPVISACSCRTTLGMCVSVYIGGLINFTPQSASAVAVLPQWGAADAEIKVPSGENTDLKRSPFKAWSRSVYSYTCYVYYQGFLPRFFLLFRSIHLHFFQNVSRFYLCWLWLIYGSCVGPQNFFKKKGHPAGGRFPC